VRRSLHLGDATSAQYAQFSASAAGAAVGAGAASAFLPAAAAGPVGAAIAGIGVLIGALIANSGCGPTCVIASKIVDQLGPQLEANRDTYLAGARTTSNQAAALANFDNAWAWLTSMQACGSPDLGDAGRRCISERARGGKYDYFVPFRDPIANDPEVVPDALPDIASVLTAAPSWLRENLLAVLLIVLGLFL
jgi:hypothetical protein